jgi:type I restriction enzyme R subunit
MKKTGLPVDEYNDEDIQTLTENVYWHVYRAYPAVPSPIYVRSCENRC